MGVPPEPFHLYTDQELMELEEFGWEWDTALYPACVDEAGFPQTAQAEE